MLRTGAGNTPGYDFTALCNEMLKRFGIFIIDRQLAVSTEAANLSAMIDTLFPAVEWLFSASGS